MKHYQYLAMFEPVAEKGGDGFVADIGVTVTHEDARDTAAEFENFFPMVAEDMKRLDVVARVMHGPFNKRLVFRAGSARALHGLLGNWRDLLDSTAFLFRSREEMYPLLVVTPFHTKTLNVEHRVRKLCPYAFEMNGGAFVEVVGHADAWARETQLRGPVVLYGRVAFFHSLQDLALARLAGAGSP